MTGKTTVEIRRLGRLISIDPFPEPLKPLLTCSIQRSEYDPKTGNLDYKQQRERLFYEDPEAPGRYLALAGFTFRITVRLRDLGYEVDYEDIRSLDLERPQFDRLTYKPHDWQKKALAIMLASDGGIFQVATATGKTVLAECMCDLFPSTEIVVTSNESPPIVTLAANLRKKYPREVALLGTLGYGGERPKRITLCHARSLKNAPIERCKLLIFDEVHGAGAPETSKVLTGVRQANMFGLSASPTGRADKAEPIVEGLFGPMLFHKSHKEAVEEELVSPVRAEIYSISGPPVLHDSFRARMKYGVVRNDVRNRAIAEIVKDNYDDKKVVIIVQDNLEHLFRLHRYLPHYTPVYGSMDAPRRSQLQKMGLLPDGYKPLWPGAHHAIAKRFRKGEITKVIATSVWDTGIDLPELQVLVRTDTQPGPIAAIQLPGRVTRKKDDPGILVDFIDRFGSIFEGRSRKRLGYYKKIGYKIVYMN